MNKQFSALFEITPDIVFLIIIFMFFVTIDEIKTIILSKIYSTRYEIIVCTSDIKLNKRNIDDFCVLICIKVNAKTLIVPQGLFTLDKLMLRKNRRSTNTLSFYLVSGYLCVLCKLKPTASSNLFIYVNRYLYVKQKL